MASKYSLHNLKRVLRDPSLVRDAIQGVRRDIIEDMISVNRYWYKYRYGFPDIDPLHPEWDNFIVLDAARPDMLKSIIDDPKEVKTVKSPVSSSAGFMRKVLNVKQLHDTIYITANPHTYIDLETDVFYLVENLLDSDWDGELETVRPEAMVSRTLKMREKHPDKRLMVHFMQPHFPFIGNTGEEIDAGFTNNRHLGEGEHPWFNQMWGDKADRDTLLAAYRENHDLVFQEVERLLNSLDGKSIITADHANLVGQRGFPFPFRMYGHPPEFPHPDLISVPWIERDGERREAVSENPVDREGREDDVVDDRLSALGYR